MPRGVSLVKKAYIMARFNKIQTLQAIIRTGMVPVYYHADVTVAQQVVKACYEGGVRAFEFTNRGDFAHEVFGELVKFAAKECPELILGVGSVVDPATAALYIQLGANFVVGPLFNPEIAKVCNRRLIPYTPGCGSVSEIGFAQENLTAWFKAGVTCVGMGSKLFPKEAIAKGEWQAITDLCRSALSIIEKTRNV